MKTKNKIEKKNPQYGYLLKVDGELFTVEIVVERVIDGWMKRWMDGWVDG